MTTSISPTDSPREPGAVARRSTRREPSRAARRAGYLIAAVINLVGLWFVHHLLAWGWPSFLTDGFVELLPYITASFVATVVVNVLWAARDPAWFRHLAQIGLNLVALLAAVRTWTIFPFDLTPYAPMGEPVVRFLIVVGGVALIGATIAELVRLIRVCARPVNTGDALIGQ